MLCIVCVLLSFVSALLNWYTRTEHLLVALIRSSTFTKPGSFVFLFFVNILFRLEYALLCQNYVYTLQIKANLSCDKQGHGVTYCNISTSCSTQCKRIAGIPAEFEFFFITRNILKPGTKIQKVNNAQNLITILYNLLRESKSGSVLVYRFTRVNTKDQTIHSS